MLRFDLSVPQFRSARLHQNQVTVQTTPGSDRPWREAQPVCHETGRTNSSPAVVLHQQLIERDRQVADADAGGVKDGVSDGSGGADDADLANALHAYGVDVGVVLRYCQLNENGGACSS